MSALVKPMAEALKQLKEEMSPKQVSVSIDANYAAFTLSGDDMETFVRDVHQYFYSEYFPKHRGKINRIVAKVADRNDEVLLTTLAGKLHNKLPPVLLRDHPGDYNEVKARREIATIICHCLMDANTFPSKIAHKRNMETGKWETLTTLFLGGDTRKELLAGLHLTPGVTSQTRCGGFGLSADHKKRLKRLSSIPFELSDIASADLIYHLYTLKDDWNKRVDKEGRKLKEDYNTKVARYHEYAELIDALQDETFYLELKYSDSGRMFYRFQLEGMRPQGKLWETLMIDSAKSYYLDQEQQRALKHMIYVTMSGERVTPLEAERRLTDEMVAECLAKDIMTAKDDEEAGEMLLLFKAATALQASQAGEPTKYLFGWDFTNSGLIMAGLSFHSENMMDAGNIHTRSDVVDMHSKFGEAFDLGVSRKDIKKVHMPMLHGASLYGSTRNVNQVSSSVFSEEEVLSKMKAAYGPEAMNLLDIADWGVKALHNEQTKFHWTLPDGFRATHKAYFQSVPVSITVASADPKHEKSHRTTHTMVMNMPYAMDNKGLPLVKVDGKAPKVRGLYANITHSLDAYVLRHVADVLLDMEMPFLLKHDDYMVHPSCYEVVLRESRVVFNELYETNLYQSAVDEISRHSKSKMPAPGLVRGNALNTINEAQAYLMP